MTAKRSTRKKPGAGLGESTFSASTGVETDPLTMLPIEQLRKQREEEEKADREEQLQSTAAWNNISQSEAGRMVVDLIMDKLQARIETLVNADPEAAAMVKLLKEIGQKEGLARSAAAEIHKRYLKRERDK